MQSKTIFLVKLHNGLNELYDFLIFQLGQIFDCNILFINEEKTSLDFAFHHIRKQYSASKIIKTLKQKYISYPGKVLFTTNVDLFDPPFNFIFGQAELGGQFAIVSLSRLNCILPNQKTSEKIQLNNEIILKKRLLKECVHELGHTFNLSHCQNLRCVMFFSNSLRDTDIKDSNFCESCKKSLFPND